MHGAAVRHPSSEHVLAEVDSLEKSGVLSHCCLSSISRERGAARAIWSSLPGIVGGPAFWQCLPLPLMAEQAFLFLPPENKSQCIAATERCLYIVISRVLGKVLAVRNGFCSSFYVISRGRFRLHVFLLDFLPN